MAYPAKDPRRRFDGFPLPNPGRNRQTRKGGTRPVTYAEAAP